MMRMHQRTTLVVALVVLGVALSPVAHAAAISGTFDMSGIVTVTTTQMTWQTDATGNAADLFSLTGGTGSFAAADGQNAVTNLNISTEPVGSTFTPTPFISFDVGPALPALDIDYIWPGLDPGSPGCTAPP